MAWPAIAQSWRTVLSPACDNPALRAGFSASEGFSPSGSFSRNRRKGGSSCKLDSPSLRRRCLPRPKLFSIYWSGGDEKMLLLRLASWTDGFHAVQASGSVRRGGKDSWRRGSVRRNRRLCSHIWASDGRRFGSKLRRSIGIAPPTADPRKSRTSPRCWDEGAGEGEEAEGEEDFSSVGDWLAAQEQAIRVQAREETRLFFSGPPRGDMAEIEAFCRIYRNAEQLNSAVMTALRANTADGGDDRDAGEEAVLEAKIATGLAHLMTKIQEGRAEILLGGTTADGAASVGADALPPFAQLRKEVRGRCETVEAALAALFSAGRSAQFTPVRARLQKLKNVCLDAGFPRPETIPGHADIPNLAPVRLRASRGGARAVYADENIAFWRGGQVTEDGLAWLVEKRFKTIVDLREAASADEKAPAGKVLPLRVVRMPMERGSVPSDEQVAEFARLVADPGNQPLYLHTLAGVGRASAMVSRWREFVLREQLRLVKQEGRVSGSVVELPRGADDLVRISLEDAQALEAFETVQNEQSTSRDDSIPAEENAAEFTMQLVPNSAAGDAELPLPGDGVEATEEAEGSVPSATNGSAHGHTGSFDVTDNAFEAQRPSNVFSRKAMSKFMKHKKIPSIFLTSRINRPNGNFAAPSNIADSLVSANIAGPANRWGLANPGIPRGDGPRAARLQSQPEPVATVPERPGNGTAAMTNGSTRLESTNGNNRPNRDESGGESDEEEVGGGGGDPSRAVNGSSKGAFVGETPGETGSSSSSSGPSDEEDLDGPCSVEGDMCASTTGVVRLQSRKKAEMFLVRTDGYSCVRERVKQSTLAFSHPSTQQQMLMWKTRPRTAMLLKKLGNELMKEAQEVASFLHHQEGMNVMVEPEVHDQLARIPGFGFVQTFHTQDANELHERVDFIVCLGGDGVILHASNLFRNAVPPVVSFNLGSLGFLTSHTFSGYREDLQEVIHGHNDMMTGVYITLRMRLRCELFRGGKAIPGKVFDVLNEVVVDRGSNPYLSKIECFERDRLITKVQADGVIVATPTGSTAYSIAAGGSMVHPNVPCMLFTPICPHSLSFRPLILPDSALLELKVPNDARNNAWVSFDGKRRQQLSKGDSVRITMSEHPLPTVNKSDQTDDWFQSLVRCLSWNERLEQRPLSGV